MTIHQFEVIQFNYHPCRERENNQITKNDD